MRQRTMVVCLGVLAAASWGMVAYTLATQGAVSVLGMATAMVLTGMLMMLPLLAARGRPDGPACPDCRQGIDPAGAWGFCLHCGSFLSPQAERAWARHT